MGLSLAGDHSASRLSTLTHTSQPYMSEGKYTLRRRGCRWTRGMAVFAMHGDSASSLLLAVPARSMAM